VSIAEGYSIALCCDSSTHDRLLPRNAEAFSETKAGARKIVKRWGWVVNWKMSESTCPVCAKVEFSRQTTGGGKP
jgi:hypothetical protein